MQKLQLEHGVWDADKETSQRTWNSEVSWVYKRYLFILILLYKQNKCIFHIKESFAYKTYIMFFINTYLLYKYDIYANNKNFKLYNSNVINYISSIKTLEWNIS